MGAEKCPISMMERDRLEHPFEEEEEVRKAVFSCEGDKAPGLDGYKMAFMRQ